MKKLIISVLLIGILSSLIACTKKGNPDDSNTPDMGILSAEEIENRNYNNSVAGADFFAIVNNRHFYVVRSMDKGWNSYKLIELSENGERIILDKQVVIGLYPLDDNSIYIFGGIDSSGEYYTRKEYIYNLTSDEVSEVKKKNNYSECLKKKNDDTYYFMPAKKIGDDLYLNDEKLIANVGLPRGVYITDDFIYYTDGFAKNYGINRYDLINKTNEIIVPITSKILDKEFGYINVEYLRENHIEKMMIEGDYLISLKSETKLYIDEDYKNYDYYKAGITVREINNLQANEVVIAEIIEDQDDEKNEKNLWDLFGFNVAAGKIYYETDGDLFAYDLETKNTTKLLTIDAQVPFNYIISVHIGIDNNIYLDTSHGLYKLPLEGGNVETVYFYDYELDYDYEDDDEDEYDEIIGFLKALDSGINYRSEPKRDSKNYLGKLKKNAIYEVYDYQECTPFKSGSYTVEGWFLIEVDGEKVYVADIKKLVKFTPEEM